MREAGETCSVHRVARIMRENKLKAQIGYKRRYIKGGKLANVAANVLDRNFNPDEPNQAWVSDITYVRTYEGFLYVATVLNLFSRRIVGWSMDKTMDRHLVIRALLTPACRENPLAWATRSSPGLGRSSGRRVRIMKALRLCCGPTAIR
jgi:putative transposase